MDYWRAVPGYDNYLVSRRGQVWSLVRTKMLAQVVGKRGYSTVNLYRDAHPRNFLVHRLVAAAFLGPISRGTVITHQNGNKLDNRPCNLKATTPVDHVRHAAALGLSWPTRMVGEANPNAKLTVDQVREMRALRQQGMSLAELGLRFGMTARAAHRVVTRRDWKHVA